MIIKQGLISLLNDSQLMKLSQTLKCIPMIKLLRLTLRMPLKPAIYSREGLVRPLRITRSYKLQ